MNKDRLSRAESHILLRTNLVVSVLLILGFAVTAALGYQANYQVSLRNIEQVSSLTSEGTYYQLQSVFSKPVNISLTMAHDSLLIGYLSEEAEHLSDVGYTQTIQEYLDTYRKKYGYESVFLVSAATGRYYDYHGIDRVLAEGDPENNWYFDMLAGSEEYSLNVDNDEIMGADNAVTVFVNCKILDVDGAALGVVGVGMRITYLQELLTDYEKEFGVRPYLIDHQGQIQISAYHTGYEKTDWFEMFGNEDIRQDILAYKNSEVSKSFWTAASGQNSGQNFVVTRYIPELSWHLIVVRDTGDLLRDMRTRLFFIIIIVCIVIAVILFIITRMIHRFDRRITILAEEKQKLFRNTSEELYDNIYELNITENRAAGRSTERYFDSLGVPRNMSYDEALHVVAQKQIREEFRQGYIDTFCTENVLREYAKGNTKLQYDFMMTEDGIRYYWTRIDARIVKYTEDDSVRMYTYRKNIDEEKQKEIRIKKEAQTDQMTGMLTKKATERAVQKILSEASGSIYCFYIFDIDNFKQVNDRYGHAFGDAVIIEFAGLIRNHFRETDITGRIGGDEFAVFVPLSIPEQAEEKAVELKAILDTVYEKDGQSWHITASIGAALAPADGTDFDTLYKKADSALYTVKNAGKNNYAFW